jgi:hypothetical protein
MKRTCIDRWRRVVGLRVQIHLAISIRRGAISVCFFTAVQTISEANFFPPIVRKKRFPYFHYTILPPKTHLLRIVPRNIYYLPQKKMLSS